MDDVFLQMATTRRLLALAALVIANLLAFSPAAGQPGGASTLRDAALLAALRKGGFIAYVRTRTRTIRRETRAQGPSTTVRASAT